MRQWLPIILIFFCLILDVLKSGYSSDILRKSPKELEGHPKSFEILDRSGKVRKSEIVIASAWFFANWSDQNNAF